MIQIKILELCEFMKATRLSRSTIYKRMREGTFPDQIKLGESERGEKGGLAGVRYRGLARRKNFSITSNQGGLDESNRSEVGTRLLQSQQVKP